jgi:hypothetical protein
MANLTFQNISPDTSKGKSQSNINPKDEPVLKTHFREKCLNYNHHSFMLVSTV